MKKDLRASSLGKDKNVQDVFNRMDSNRISDAKKLYNQYAGKDENELKSTLFSMAQKGRQEGTLSDSEIDSMAKRIAPMLDGQKREKLNSIVAMLKQNSLE